MIRGHMLSVKESKGRNGEIVSFAFYYRRSARRLKIVVEKLWPSRTMWPTLYTGRHQFAANLKKAGYSRLEIAALMGHATDETAHSHYGKKKAGRKTGGLVQALESEVQRIRVVMGEWPTHKFRTRNSRTNSLK